MAKKRVLFIGFGSYARKWHEMMKKRDDLDFVCAVKRTSGDLGKSGTDLAGIQYRASLPEAIREFSPDFVFNLTPPKAHFAAGKTALELDVPVLSEKPVAETFTEAMKLLKMRRSRRRPYVVSQKFRYMAWARTMRRVLDDGLIGEPGQANIYFYDSPHFWPGAYYLEVEQPFLSDYCPHSFDLIRYILGKNPATVYAHSLNPSWSWFKGKASASVFFGFPNGLVVNYYGTWVASGKSTTQNGDWRIDGSKGTLIFENDRLFLEKGRDDRSEIPIPPNEKPDEMIILDEFLRILETEVRAETDIEDNIFSMQMVSRAIESAKSGQPKDLKTAF